ncbi:hypothetical protein HPL003_16320 [Paenibacillus terrae HPL-003]|uniref:Uncharacterized protein n=1 Tax=Paenibacillus terrae (strain HPL-003) TaxID=985665 RepID=G7W0S3_PAETH|nr:hypothetical protein HPL003_16320 [Paenibacillus terrae HPL-003]
MQKRACQKFIEKNGWNTLKRGFLDIRLLQWIGMKYKELNMMRNIIHTIYFFVFYSFMA